MRNIAQHVIAVILVLAAPTTAWAQDFDVEAEAEACAACHGADGVPVNEDAPIIWGQEFYYLYVQLRDYKAGRRAHEIMSEIVAPYEKKQLQALAQYFAEKDWPQIAAEGADDVRNAAQAALAAGQCSQCHSTYVGDSRVPRLAGQLASYLERTMLDFKNKVRLNAPDKGLLMRSYEDTQLTAIARYLAAL